MDLSGGRCAWRRRADDRYRDRAVTGGGVLLCFNQIVIQGTPQTMAEMETISLSSV